jgi:hypothetical protein
MLADTARPLTLVYGPFGAANEVEMLMGRRDTRLNGLAPLTSYARARVAIPLIVERAKTFSAYADANVDQLLAATRTQVSRLEAVTLDHTVFLNRGDPARRRWHPRSTPASRTSTAMAMKTSS